MTTHAFNFTFEEVIAEAERLTNKNADGFTVSEMVEATGHCDNWCRVQLKKLITAGKLKCNGKAQRRSIDGRKCMVPAYVFIREGV